MANVGKGLSRFPWLGYVAAIAGPVLITDVQLRVDNLQAPLFTYFFYILLVANTFSLGASLLGAVAATLTSNYFFLAPVGHFVFTGPNAYPTLFSSVMMLVACLMMHTIKKRTRRLLDNQVELEDLARRLQDAVSARDDFLAVAGHELKTPLTALLLRTQSLERRLRTQGSNNPRMLDTLRGQVRDLKRLGTLVEQLLDVSRISTGRIELHREWCELGTVVQDIAQHFSDYAAESGTTVTVHVAHAPRGWWDRSRLEQVLTNLMSNAVKYGAGQPVELRVGERGGMAHVDVIDHGHGIAPADLERIFQRFERLPSKRQVGGLGLGLWIGQELANAMGGSITVRSTVGTGTTFTLQLPAEQAGRHDGGPNLTRLQAGSGPA